MSAVAQPWLISKYALFVSYGLQPRLLRLFTDIAALHRFFDPVFAVCVGISAAAVRIRREEKEKYPDQNNDYSALWAKGVRMGKSYFGGHQDNK